MTIKKSKYAFPEIPVRFRFAGDIEKCESLTRFASQQLSRKLEIDAANKYNKYLKVNRRWPTIKSSFGEAISMQLIQGVAVIDIFVPVHVGDEEVPCEKYTCLCGCGITTGGVIMSPYSVYNKETKSWEHDLDRIPSADDSYKIEVCMKTEFVEKLNTMSSLDFYPHKVNSDNKMTNYFVVEEGFFAGIHHDLLTIKACEWESFHLTSLEYAGPEMRKEICM